MSNRDRSLWPLVLLVCLSFLMCMIAVFVLNHFTVLGLNAPFMFWLNVSLLVVITVYVLYRVFRKEPTFNQISNKDKVFELMEDTDELEETLKQASHRATKNKEKLWILAKEIFPSKKEIK